MRLPVAADDFTQPLGGVGGVGVPPVAPALANAISAVTGKRLQTLPLGDPSQLRIALNGKESGAYQRSSGLLS